jgi:carbon-monoxide dehydrogenase iron sulfur subunit
MMVCPFGSIVIHERKAHKCNQCPDQDTPACIKACSKRAIALVDPEKLKLEKQKRSQFINILTSNTRAKKVLHKEDNR